MTTIKDGPFELQERTSYIHSATRDESAAYGAVSSPKDVEDLEGGALVAGGALPLMSREAIALYSQYFAIGILYGMLPALQFPVFNNYLRLEGYQTSAYGVLVWLGWSFKAFFGMLSDCFPIFGYRRKSWMLLGWGVAAVCLCVMTFTPFAAPYCDARKITCPAVTPPKENLTRDGTLEWYNFDAPNSGGSFIVLSVIVGFGYIMADCAADAMVVEYAQREPIAIRGRTQTAIYVVRYIGTMVAQLSVAFLLNGKVYGGSFDFAVTPNVMYAICLVPCVLIVPSTLFLLVEHTSPRTSFRAWVADFWRLLQTRVMWQVCAFKFLNTMFASFGATPSSPIARTWAGVEPINDSLSGVLGSLITAGIMAVMAKWGLNWNWRWVIALSSIAIVAIDSFVVFTTVWNVVRNQWFYNGVALSENVPSSMRFIVATYCAVEIAEAGNEGTTYGLISTVTNLASPFSSVLYKYIDSFFKVSQSDIARDDNAVRWDVTYCFLLSYAFKLAALGWLFLLPPQKAAIQHMKKHNTSSKLAGTIFVVLAAGSLVFSVTTNFMSIYPSTKCYRIAGGKGTVNGSCPK
ncbi:Folate-Biopterin Transporter (FBT) Family [Achlya hypogyna]|uniref:Folate-Biopterin Transporter (FBT) Family n=1 Tax=Achlya hypogyna TaxID=1202772 RepID=A0A1V9YUY1_ACHHY|nr:Folate-Biopterin Transporter (FBT) Family [Achlya hypogyna]